MPSGHEDLPPAARRRLDAASAPTGSTTSFLSSAQQALLGLFPGWALAQVTGSAIVQLSNLQSLRVAGSREMGGLTRLLAGGRGSALGGLAEEARLVGADAVVGIELTQLERPWATGLLEFRALGTAVRMELRPRASRPVLTNLSAQDLWTLARAGGRALGLAAGTCAYFASAGGVGWKNTTRESLELRHLSTGIARSTAIARRHLRDAAARLGAEGVVGLQLIREAHELGHSVAYVTHLLGTAVAGLAPRPEPVTLRPVLDLGAGA